MGNFGEMSGLKQWVVVVAGAVLVSAGLYYTVFKSQRDHNLEAQQKLEAKQKENQELEAYRPKLAEIERQLASMKQQLDIEVNGSFYSMLNFFDRVGKLERIVNVSGLMMASTRKPQDAKPKKTYQYAPNESVVATCTATTFFSHDLDPGPGGKPGQAPVKR